jgi:predicted protein tyrosine phosphatase
MPILVSPLSQVAAVTAARKPARLVSLLDPGSAFPRDGLAAHHLKIGVHDVTFDEQDPWVVPRADHVRAVLDFVADWDRSAPVLVHCYAGISRSTATAYTIACALNAHADEDAIARALRAASPTASPNTRLIALADAALGRQGRMVRAIEAIGRGAVWEIHGEAEPFELPSRFA